MNIYAISWVMASHIDSHIKALFAQNSCLKINGFIFPIVKVDQLCGIKIYSYENFIYDSDAIYVDFSFGQSISASQKELLIKRGVNIIGINEWLNILADDTDVKNPILLDGIPLSDLKNIFIDNNTIALIEPISRQLLIKLLLNFHNLDMRLLHEIKVQTYENFIYESVFQLASDISGGDIRIFNYTNDDFISDTSRVCFGLCEFRNFSIYKNKNLIYTINGRDAGSSINSITFTTSNDLCSNMTAIDSDNFYVVIFLNRGLLDVKNSLLWLMGFKPKFFDFKFHQISSKINDAYLVCRISNSYIY
jgi:hypothetical protein